jgi:hypothetical protein
MSDVLQEFFLRVAFADGFPGDLGEAGVLEQGGVESISESLSTAISCAGDTELR